MSQPRRDRHPRGRGDASENNTRTPAFAGATGLIAAWRFIRALSMDDAYERYLAHHRAVHAERAPLDRRAFYLREQQRKWTGVSRCC